MKGQAVHDGYSVFSWPEFHAFCSLLKLDKDSPTFKVMTGIRVEMSTKRTRIKIWRRMTGTVNDSMEYDLDEDRVGYKLYHDPDFIALCRRLGFEWERRTIEQTFEFKEGEMARITQVYNPVDNGPVTPPHEADDGQ